MDEKSQSLSCNIDDDGTSCNIDKEDYINIVDDEIEEKIDLIEEKKNLSSRKKKKKCCNIPYTLEERVRNIKGLVNIMIVMLALFTSLTLSYTSLILIMPWKKEPILKEAPLQTMLTLATALLGVFLFFINEDFSEDFEFALDRRCSTLLIKVFVMILLSFFLFCCSVTIFLTPSILAFIYEDSYFSRYVLDSFHRLGVILLGISFWGFYMSINKLSSRMLKRKRMLEKDIVEFLMKNQSDMKKGEIRDLSSRGIYNYLKKEKSIKCSFLEFRKFAVELMYSEDGCAKCKKKLLNLKLFSSEEKKDGLITIEKL